MAEPYDPQNIFARILRGEIPNDTVAESEHSLAFRDIAPKAPTHILVIPKGAYVDFVDFSENASDAEIGDFMRLAARVAKEAGMAPAVGGGGFRAIANSGDHGGQEVAHFHLHLVGGAQLGRMVSTA